MDKDAIKSAASVAAAKLTPTLADLLLKSNALQTFIQNFNPYASITDLATFLQIPHRTVQGWVASGKLPCTKVAGRTPKLYLADLKKFVAEHGRESQ